MEAIANGDVSLVRVSRLSFPPRWRPRSKFLSQPSFGGELVLQLVPHLKVFVCIAPVDFRNGLDGLGGVCRKRFEVDPVDGAIYVFRNRAGTCLKMIVNDGVGGWLITRRFSRGKLAFWPTADDTILHSLVAHELAGEAEQLVDQDIVIRVGELALADTRAKRSDLGVIDGASRGGQCSVSTSGCRA